MNKEYKPQLSRRIILGLMIVFFIGLLVISDISILPSSRDDAVILLLIVYTFFVLFQELTRKLILTDTEIIFYSLGIKQRILFKNVDYFKKINTITTLGKIKYQLIYSVRGKIKIKSFNHYDFAEIDDLINHLRDKLSTIPQTEMYQNYFSSKEERAWR